MSLRFDNGDDDGQKWCNKSKKTGSQGGLLPPMMALQDKLTGIIQGPVSCELDKRHRQQMAPLGEQCECGISPDREKAFYTQIIP